MAAPGTPPNVTWRSFMAMHDWDPDDLRCAQMWSCDPDEQVIFVKTRNDTTFVVDVKATDTIENVKAKLEVAEGIPREQQRLHYDGKPLRDCLTLDNYMIKDLGILRVAVISISMSHSLNGILR